MPDGYVPLDEEDSLDDLGETPDFTGKAPKKAAEPNHYNDAIKVMQTIHAGKYWRVDYKEMVIRHWKDGRPSFDGMQIFTKDMLGFADIAGIAAPHGSFIAVQVTSKAAVQAHLRKYTSKEKTHGSNKIPIETHLREFLACGGKFYVLGFHQPKGKGTKWLAEVTIVTPELLDLYKSRKRKAK
jgi:hypothetical protein